MIETTPSSNDLQVSPFQNEYDAIFSTLNFSSPKIYISQTSYRTICRSIDTSVEGCQSNPSNELSYQCELVLEEWYHIDGSIGLS
ncbi:hypothetical protein C8R48DRAFT_125647 [Suillus tomentosus]|nr:hypothetical protein C8R48DRAFT_125647 [Suillus tomentosus]